MGNTHTAGGSRTGSEPLTDQEAFDLLSSRRRRLALYCLDESEGSATIGELATAVAAVENDVPESEVTRRQRKRVYTALRQSHLPRMADAGVVDYDADRGTVAATPDADRLREYLQGSEASTDWAPLYGSVLVVAVLGSLASVAAVPPFAAVSWVAWVLSLVVGVGALAGAQVAVEGTVAPLEWPGVRDGSDPDLSGD